MPRGKNNNNNNNHRARGGGGGRGRGSGRGRGGPHGAPTLPATPPASRPRHLYPNSNAEIDAVIQQWPGPSTIPGASRVVVRVHSLVGLSLIC
jgi:hypothetical protein